MNAAQNLAHHYSQEVGITTLLVVYDLKFTKIVLILYAMLYIGNNADAGHPEKSGRPDGCH